MPSGDPNGYGPGAMEPTRMTFTGSDGITIVADRRGDPDADQVIFLHGGGQTRHSWGGTADAIAERGWCSWALDARGHGESDWAPGGDYRLASFAADVEMVIGEIGGQPAIVGASLGGLTALLLLGRLSPGVARGLVLVDIVPDMEKSGTDRIAAFMTANAETGFASLEEAADSVAAYNHHRDRPPSVDGLLDAFRPMTVSLSSKAWQKTFGSLVARAKPTTARSFVQARVASCTRANNSARATLPPRAC